MPNPALTSDEGIGIGQDSSLISIPLTLPMPLKELPSGEVPKHLASHPELNALLDLWTTMSASELPRRSQFTLAAIKRWASHLSIATVLPGERFQFSLFGTELQRVYGCDITGRFLDELTPRDLWSVVTLHYQMVARTRKPLFAPISISNGHWYCEVSRLLLPLSSDGHALAFVMGADYSRSSV